MSAQNAAKADFAQDTLKQESENIGKTLESEEAYRSSESRIQKVVDFMIAEPKALAGMLSAAGISLDDSAHGSTVSSLVLAVGAFSKQMGRDELTDMAVAGLLHDTSLTKLGFDAKADFDAMTKEQKASYRKHPELSMESVAGKKFITPRVMRNAPGRDETRRRGENGAAARYGEDAGGGGFGAGAEEGGVGNSGAVVNCDSRLS